MSKDIIQLLNEEKHDFESLISIMEILRGPDGCPWDMVQNHKSIRKCLIEETYEVVEAIDNSDSDLLREELGDLIFQAVFHAKIEEELNNFNIYDVVNDICKKMLNRHPHVFGNKSVETAEVVSFNWDEIKIREHKQANIIDSVKKVPPSLPALIKAQKVHNKANKNLGVGFANKEEALNFAREAMSSSISDAVFALAAAADFDGEDLEMNLTNTINSFIEYCEENN